MAHIGALFPGVPGHLNPLSCLARELQARGHRVTAFQVLDLEEAVCRNGMEFQPVGQISFPPGEYRRHVARLGELESLAALRYTVSFFVRKAEMMLDEAPDALRRAGIELVLADQTEGAASTVAERVGIPYITVSNALILNREPEIPPFFTHWPYATGFAGKLRNQLASALTHRLTRPMTEVLNRQRRAWNLPIYRTIEEMTSPLAHISQQPPCFDFPRRLLPPQFHYTGPWQDRRTRPPVPFPYEKLNGKPLIYASMGTLQNRIGRAFQEIAKACEDLDAQLVISLGGGSTPEQIGPLAGNPLVVSFAPQLDLLARATLTITHAGLNTALESLSYGVPMVAIPVGNDQPGVASRVKWLGAGEVLPFTRLSSNRLRPLVKRVLTEQRYRERARQLQGEIVKADGINRAAQVVERVLAGQKPVLRAAAQA